jgi:MscS family membrane protein
MNRNALALLVAHVFSVIGVPALQHRPQLEKVWQQLQEQFSGIPAGFAAVAVRDIATNLAGGAMLQVVHPFQVGDQVSFRHAGQLIEGTIVQRGLYYTTVQSRDTTPHYVPNSAFLSASVSNLSRVLWQYCETQLTLPLSFADKAASITTAIKARLSALPNVSARKPVTASVTALGPNTLTVHVSCYFRKGGKRSARDLQHQFLLEVLNAARQQGAALLTSPPAPSQAQ